MTSEILSSLHGSLGDIEKLEGYGIEVELKQNNLQLLLFLSCGLILFHSSPSLGQAVPASSPTAAPEPQNQILTFEEIFGKPRKEAEQVIVPFFIDGQRKGQVLLTLGNLTSVQIQAAPLLTEIGKVIRPETQANLTSAANTEGNLSLEILQQNGLDATFDPSKLELQIQVPPAQRRTNIASLNERGLPADTENALPPSLLSGYINFRLDQDYNWWGSEQINPGRQALGVALDGALNYHNWVLEARGNFLERRKPGFRRGDLQIVRDAPNQALRYVIGDLAIPITGYQNSQPQIGISVAKNFSLKPNTITRPISQYEFFLENDSSIDIFVNGRLERTLQLPAGRQDIRDLPQNIGTNNIELVITDEFGRVQRLSFSNPVAADLLAPNSHKFAYSLGFPRFNNSSDYNYNFTKPTLTLSHRLGITNYLSVGSYLQANFDQQLSGLEGTWATRYGNFTWDIALSGDRDLGIDYATRLNYEYSQQGDNNPLQRSFRLAIESKGSNFIRVGEDDPNNNFFYDITANYSQRLLGNIRGNLNARYQFGRDIRNIYRIGINLSRNFRNGLNINVNLAQNLDQTGVQEQRAYINFSWQLSKNRQFFRASSDLDTQGKMTHRLNWNNNPLRTIGTPKSSIGVTQNDSNYNLTGRLSYTGYRFNWDLSNDSLFSVDEASGITNTTKLNFGTALVFADGHFGWSRPINNSFALVIAKESLRDQEIGINPSSIGYTTRLDHLGSGVVSDLNPYNISNLIIDAPNLPVGVDLENRAITVLPTYRSGTLVKLGINGTVFLRGVLLNTNSEPVSLQSGQVISMSDPNWQPVTLFTNKAGRFATAGLNPGRYEIRLFTKPPLVFQLQIPEGTRGLYDIGNLQSP